MRLLGIAKGATKTRFNMELTNQKKGCETMETIQTEAKRETWLAKATDYLRPMFDAQGYQIPCDVRVTCGFPSSMALRSKNGRRAIGMCWSRGCSDANINEIAISPCLSGETDSLQVLATLVHELVHAVDDCKNGHGPVFKRIALAVGLEGKMTATHASTGLNAHLQKFIDAEGFFPHATLDVVKGHKKQSTRMIKASCVNDFCEFDERGNLYTVRLSRSWLEKGGAPICPICQGEMEIAE